MKNRLKNFIKNNWILILILLIGLAFRIYKPLQLYMYGHDQDLAGWIVKDILINKHLRLIGQETSSQGVFIGPLFYYLQIPFYLLTRMDSWGTLILVTLLGLFSIFSFYFCFSKIFGRKAGLISAFLYAIGVYFIFTDREVVPTMPVHLWAVWFFYGLHLLLKGKSGAYILLGILLGLAWNINLALVILTPLILLAQYLSKKNLNFKHIAIGIILFVVTFSPFLVFELRHSFRQTRAIVTSLTTSKDYVQGTSRGIHKLNRVYQIVKKNTSAVIWGRFSKIGYSLTLFILLGIYIFLLKKKIIQKNMGIIMTAWLLIYVIFFTLNSINISEYYLNGMNVVWIAILSLFINYLLNKKYWGYLVIFIIAVSNLREFVLRPINRSGYLERKAIVEYIDSDAKLHNYPCISVSYITSPGNNLGYRCFFWLNKMHVNQPKSGSPVYSIVFPHSMVDRIDKDFGALGLILPDYKKYTESQVKDSCQGANSNLVDPMGGYTK